MQAWGEHGDERTHTATNGRTGVSRQLSIAFLVITTSALAAVRVTAAGPTPERARLPSRSRGRSPAMRQNVGGGNSSAGSVDELCAVRVRIAHPTGTTSSGGGSGGLATAPTCGSALTSSARRPSMRMSGVPHFLHDITVPSSVHFQHVGQQTFMTTAHSHQRNRCGGAPSRDGAMTVTCPAQKHASGAGG